ncbi:MAG TPA: zinc ribbon domain-containing protein, partial [Bacteroides graminisolvens]|nr:zinc ribbon domain-containing protein [Bacteroides graminisolvens]
SKFCPECGEIIRDDLCCTNCGARLRQNSKFCTNCGNKVNG